MLSSDFPQGISMRIPFALQPTYWATQGFHVREQAGLSLRGPLTFQLHSFLSWELWSKSNLLSFPACKRRTTFDSISNFLSCSKNIIYSFLESHHWKAAGKMTKDKLAIRVCCSPIFACYGPKSPPHANQDNRETSQGC